MPSLEIQNAVSSWRRGMLTRSWAACEDFSNPLHDVSEVREGAFVHENAPRLGSLVARDDAPPLEHVDQASGPRVADSEAALDERDGGRLRLDDDLDRLLQQRVLVGIELAVGLAVPGRCFGRLEQRLVQLLLALPAALLDDQRDLLLGHERALEPLQARGAERLEEHVALAQQALRAVLVEDHARVGLA